jgi:hypothetical protein
VVFGVCGCTASKNWGCTGTAAAKLSGEWSVLESRHVVLRNLLDFLPVGEVCAWVPDKLLISRFMH